MSKIILVTVAFFISCIIASAQTSQNKTLFVIDSIPVLTDPEDWNQVLTEDIAGIYVMTSKDSLREMGYGDLHGITYIFTKEYRNRPDSIKSIPALRQMEMKDGLWRLHDSIYSGKYIDYYYNGKKQNEGNLLNGQLDGELTIWFKNGNKRSVIHYKNGTLHGEWDDYYTNGTLLQTREYGEGRLKRGGKTYFINGQVQYEMTFKNKTPYDTAFAYYSNGKLKKINLVRNGVVTRSKKEEEINFYTPQFYQNINDGDITAANRNFFKIWMADSTSEDTYFKEGLLLLKERRFDAAIARFDHALAIEPLLREALVHRALARLKKYQAIHDKTLFDKNNDGGPLTIDDMLFIPDDEEQKICHDLQQALYVDFSDSYVKKKIPAVILDYCREKASADIPLRKSF